MILSQRRGAHCATAGPLTRALLRCSRVPPFPFAIISAAYAVRSQASGGAVKRFAFFLHACHSDLTAARNCRCYMYRSAAPLVILVPMIIKTRY